MDFWNQPWIDSSHVWDHLDSTGWLWALGTVSLHDPVDKRKEKSGRDKKNNQFHKPAGKRKERSGESQTPFLRFKAYHAPPGRSAALARAMRAHEGGLRMDPAFGCYAMAFGWVLTLMHSTRMLGVILSGIPIISFIPEFYAKIETIDFAILMLCWLCWSWKMLRQPNLMPSRA